MHSRRPARVLTAVTVGWALLRSLAPRPPIAPPPPPPPAPPPPRRGRPRLLIAAAGLVTLALLAWVGGLGIAVACSVALTVFAVHAARGREAHTRELRVREYAAVLVMALAAVAAWVAVGERAQPAWELPSVGLATLGLTVPENGQLIGRVTVHAPRPSLLGGCPKTVRVNVRFDPPDKLLAAVNQQHVTVLSVHSRGVGKVSSLDSGIWVSPELKQRGEVTNSPRPHLRQAWAAGLFHSPDDTGKVQSGTFRTFSFKAYWVADRAVGSCWVQLPALSGIWPSQAYPDATSLARHERIRYDAAASGGQQLVSGGVSTLTGGRIDRDASLPAPALYPNTWNCLPETRNDVAAELVSAVPDCSAWAAVDAPWRKAARDVALVLCGALLSLGVELLVRVAELARVRPGTP